MLLTFNIVHAVVSEHEVIGCFDNSVCRNDKRLHNIFVFDEVGIGEAGGMCRLDKCDICEIAFM